MLEVIEWTNRLARAMGYLVIGAFVGWLLVVAVEALARASWKRKQEQKKRDLWGDDEP